MLAVMIQNYSCRLFKQQGMLTLYPIKQIYMTCIYTHNIMHTMCYLSAFDAQFPKIIWVFLENCCQEMVIHQLMNLLSELKYIKLCL